MIDTSNIEKVADECVGWEWKRHGRDKGAVDCYGLLLHVFGELGVELPDFDYQEVCGPSASALVIDNMHSVVQEIPDRKDVKAGDIVLLKGLTGEPTHMGVMMSRTKFIHGSKKGVSICRVNNRSVGNIVLGYYRLTGLRNA